MPAAGDIVLTVVVDPIAGINSESHLTPPASGAWVLGKTAAGAFQCIQDATPSTDGLMSAAMCSSVSAMANAPSFQNAAFAVSPGAARAIQTVAAAANGYQVSATKTADVSYSMRFSTTATIGGASNCEAVLEICATNSAVAPDWAEIDRTGSGQTITLAVALQSVQTTVGKVSGKVPAGWYARVRRAIQTGTSSVTAVSGQEYVP